MCHPWFPVLWVWRQSRQSSAECGGFFTDHLPDLPIYRCFLENILITDQRTCILPASQFLCGIHAHLCSCKVLSYLLIVVSCSICSWVPGKQILRWRLTYWEFIRKCFWFNTCRRRRKEAGVIRERTRAATLSQRSLVPLHQKPRDRTLVPSCGLVIGYGITDPTEPV